MGEYVFDLKSKKSRLNSNWGNVEMTKASETLVEAIERVRQGRTLVEDEYGYLRMKKDLTYLDGVRLFFRKWGSFISIIISIIALAVSILK